MNNLTTKVQLLTLLACLQSIPSLAGFNFHKLVHDLDSHNNKVQFQAKKELHDYEYLEALLKRKLGSGEDLALVMKVIKVIHVKYLLQDLMKDAKKWANVGVYSTINSLEDKENKPLIFKFYEEQIQDVAAGDLFLKDAYVDFYEYNNKQIDFPLVMKFLTDESLDLRVKVAQYFYSVQEKYSVAEINTFSNKALSLGPYQLRLEVLVSLDRLSRKELRKLKINTHLCRKDINEKVKQACKNIRKYF